MEIIYSKVFQKQFNKLDNKIKKQFVKKIEIFIRDPFNIILNNHKLNSPFENHRSINITGDFSVLCLGVEKDIILFTNIGTYSELYK